MSSVVQNMSLNIRWAFSLYSKKHRELILTQDMADPHFMHIHFGEETHLISGRIAKTI